MEKIKDFFCICFATVCVYFVFIKMPVSSINDGIKAFHFFFQGEEVNAQIISEEYNRVYNQIGGHCKYDYLYEVNNKEYSGKDSLPGRCLENTNRIKAFYLKDAPEKSDLGFDLANISISIFFPAGLMLVIVRIFRNKTNRTKFCIAYIVSFSAFILIVAAVVALSIFSSSTYYDDFWVFLIGRVFLIILYVILSFFAAKGILRQIKKYYLYKEGVMTTATICGIKDNTHRDNITCTVYYEYELNNNKYSGIDPLFWKEDPDYKLNDTISILYNPNKKNISCIDY